MKLKLIQIVFLSVLLTVLRVNANIEPPSLEEVRSTHLRGVKATSGGFKDKITHYEGTLHTKDSTWTLVSYQSTLRTAYISQNSIGCQHNTDTKTSTLSARYLLNVSGLNDVVAKMTVPGLYTVSPDKKTWVVETKTPEIPETCGCF